MSELIEYLAAPPRMLGRVLDVTVRAARLPPEWAWWADRVVVRLFTGDPYEAEREGPDRFLANHLLEEPQVILYLSWGEAELDAAEMGWEAYLSRAWSTAVGAAVDHDEVCRMGRYTAERLARNVADAAAGWREPLDATAEWGTSGWAGYSLGTMVDIVEAEYGLLGFSPAPLDFDEPGEGAPDCPACNGRPVFVPHSPVEVVQALCGDHEAEWDVRSADRIPSHEGEAKRALATMLLSAAMPRAPAGFWAGLRRVDPDSGPSQYGFLERVAEWCRHDDVDLDGVAYADEALTDAMPFGLGAIARDMSVDAALEAAEFRRALAPSQCWGPDLDMMGILRDAGRHEEAVRLGEHLVTHGREFPFVYHAVGESYHEEGDTEQAERWYRKTLARSVALDLDGVADLGVAGLRRLLTDAGEAGERLRWLDQIEATLEQRGPGALRPGRNEQCLCGSGRKWKQCCG